MIAGLDWRDLSAIVAVVGAVGSLAVVFVRDRLSGDFARRGDVEALGRRVGLVEDRIATMPDHNDIRALGHRVAELERGVAIVSTEVRGANELLARMDRHLQMLVEHHLREGAEQRRP